MQDTLADNWRQRMAGRSALCAVLLAVPVAVAAQISFSAGLDNVPFGVSNFAAGPDSSSIGRIAATPGQNLVTLLDDSGTSAGAAGPSAAGGAAVDGGVAPATGGGGSGIVSGGAGDSAPDSPIIGQPETGSGGGNIDAPGSRDNTTPPAPDPAAAPPAPVATPPAETVEPVPGVNVPNVGGVVDDVTAPVDQAAGLLPGAGNGPR